MSQSSKFKTQEGFIKKKKKTQEGGPSWVATASCLFLYNKSKCNRPLFLQLGSPPEIIQLFVTLKASLAMTLILEALPKPQPTFLPQKKSVFTQSHTFHTSHSFHKQCPEKDYQFSKRSQIFSKFPSLLPE